MGRGLGRVGGFRVDVKKELSQVGGSGRVSEIGGGQARVDVNEELVFCKKAKKNWRGGHVVGSQGGCE